MEHLVYNINQTCWKRLKQVNIPTALLEVKTMDKKKGSRKIYRDAGTGRFVRPGYARTHPKTTVSETLKPRKRK